MATRISEPQRIVQNVTITIVTLRIANIGNDIVWLDETAKLRVVITRIVIIKPRVLVQNLSGVSHQTRRAKIIGMVIVKLLVGCIVASNTAGSWFEGADPMATSQDVIQYFASAFLVKVSNPNLQRVRATRFP